MQHIKGPDFPTGGYIVGREGIKEAYETGRGRVVMRGRAHIEPLRGGKEAIIVTELPFMVKKGGKGNLIDKIADLVRDKKISEISDLRDETDRSGMRLVIELKRDAIPEVVLNKLYKHTSLQQTFGVNMVALADGVPRTLDLREVIRYYVLHQKEVVTRRTKDELERAERRAHILEGLLIALVEHRRGDQADPLLAGSRAGARGPDREVRAVGRAGAGDPRHAPPAPDRARDRQDQVRARRPDGAHQGAARDPRRGGAPLRPDQGGAARDQGDLRRRAPQRDHRRRGRGRPRGHDRRGADGDLDHSLRLHQAPAALDLPQAEARRHRRDRDGDQGGRLHRAPAHLLDARLPAVLHQLRQGLPPEGLRAARGRAHRQGPRAGQPAAAARGRARARGDPDARLLRAQVRRVRHAQRA